LARELGPGSALAFVAGVRDTLITVVGGIQ
jgi:hypothetical protein